MTREDRIQLISSITKNQVFSNGQQGRRLRYQGESKDFKVFEIPLGALIYNVENGRISSFVKSFQKQKGTLDPEKPEGFEKIAKFLYDSAPEQNKRTREDIAKCGQMEPGIITADGVIVDGNRRVSLMWEIINDKNTPADVKAKCEKFRTVVLPENASKKDIIRLETTYQLGADEKVGYNPIEKYLHARDMQELGFSVAEIEEYMNEKSGKVQELLEVVELIDQYLTSCDCEGIYTRMPDGFEDDLLKLNTAIKKIRKGAISWIPNNKLPKVENDLKTVCYDYMRLNMKSADGFDFRLILQTAGGNFLQNEDVWNNFVEGWQNATDDVEEQSIDELVDEAKDAGDLERLLNKRDNEWKKQVKEPMKDAFKNAKDIIENQREKEKPNALLRKVINALRGIELETIYRTPDKSELENQMIEIHSLCSDIERAIQSNNE